MIKIQKITDVEEDFFTVKTLDDSTEVVASVLEEVLTKGDAALRIYGNKFDVSVPKTFEVPQEELKQAAENLKIQKRDVYDAIVYSHELALQFATLQRKSMVDFKEEIAPGIIAGQKQIPVSSAGCYVPAGRFPLVSSVIMTVTPAVAAGVENIILCTPPRVHPDDKIEAGKSGSGIHGKAFNGGKPYADEAIMAAAYICGVNHLYAVGGSQAIGAMAYGTESIPKVDVIVGPGNKFVASAKKAVYGTVGIDMVAGPTEVVIMADSKSKPEWVAADMLAQAEHDVVAQAVLITDSQDLANKVSEQIEIQLEKLTTKAIARQSIDNFGRIIVVDSLLDGVELVNKKAPEHLELSVSDSSEIKKLQAKLKNYGSLFIGEGSAEVFGDYAAGINHTLPTVGAAKYTGGLSVRMFLKTVTNLEVDIRKNGAVKSGVAASVLGDAEGLNGHSNAAKIRFEK